jgi:hypothetical protein
MKGTFKKHKHIKDWEIGINFRFKILLIHVYERLH